MIVIFEKWKEVKESSPIVSLIHNTFNKKTDQSYIIDNLHHESPVFRKGKTVEEVSGKAKILFASNVKARKFYQFYLLLAQTKIL